MSACEETKIEADSWNIMNSPTYKQLKQQNCQFIKKIKEIQSENESLKSTITKMNHENQLPQIKWHNLPKISLNDPLNQYINFFNEVYFRHALQTQKRAQMVNFLILNARNKYGLYLIHKNYEQWCYRKQIPIELERPQGYEKWFNSRNYQNNDHLQNKKSDQSVQPNFVVYQKFNYQPQTPIKSYDKLNYYQTEPRINNWSQINHHQPQITQSEPGTPLRQHFNSSKNGIDQLNKNRFEISSSDDDDSEIVDILDSNNKNNYFEDAPVYNHFINIEKSINKKKKSNKHYTKSIYNNVRQHGPQSEARLRRRMRRAISSEQRVELHELRRQIGFKAVGKQDLILNKIELSGVYCKCQAEIQLVPVPLLAILLNGDKNETMFFCDGIIHNNDNKLITCDPVPHCPNFECVEHPQGYDLCRECFQALQRN